jgi:hypothetical protein
VYHRAAVLEDAHPRLQKLPVAGPRERPIQGRPLVAGTSTRTSTPSLAVDIKQPGYRAGIVSSAL